LGSSGPGRYSFCEVAMPAFRPYRFAVVSHTPELETVMGKTMPDHEIRLDFFEFSYENPLRLVQDLLDQGYEVVICYSSLGASLLYELGSSLVVIPRDDYEIIKALLAIPTGYHHPEGAVQFARNALSRAGRSHRERHRSACRRWIEPCQGAQA